MAETHWLLNTGLTYRSTRTGAERYAAAGYVVDDIPDDSARWLAKDGDIKATKAKLEPKPPARKRNTGEDDD